MGLNPAQQEAVLHGDGPILVLAGAGSGKTRVLTSRIARLILRGEVPPDRLLAVTFTNKAAGEMRSRVEAMLGFEAAGLWIGTFHSICLRILRRHGGRLGFRGDITVFDQDDQTTVWREVLKTHGGDAEAPRLREVQSAVSMAKNRMWSPDDLERLWSHPDRARYAALYHAYDERLRSQDGADFDDLLLLAVRLLNEDAEIGDAYARKFIHVLIDEYQDTNPIQFQLAHRLTREHGNVFVVGDDDQSIYGWRGADISNILEFEDRFPNAHVVRMTQNYRSTSPILNLANAVVRNNQERREKELWTDRSGGTLPEFILAQDEEEEARRVVDRVRREVRAGERTYGQAAILYRVHAQSRPLEEACLDAGVPYAIVGGVVFYQRKEVKDLLAYARLAANPRDEISFARALAAPTRGIGTVSLARILATAPSRAGDLARTCAELPDEAGLRGLKLKETREFGQLLMDLRGRSDEGPESVLREVVERTGYLDWLRESGETKWEERQANVLELLEGAARFQQVHGHALQTWLDQVALYTNLDERADDGDRVTLMTVHNAKGLEFPMVFVTGLEEGLFPHASAFDDPHELEEERRLFYVASTRAMRLLCLSASLDRRRVNWMGTGGLSRFLHEIPPECLDPASASRLAAALAQEFSDWRGPSFGNGGGRFDRASGRSSARSLSRASRSDHAGEAIDSGETDGGLLASRSDDPGRKGSGPAASAGWHPGEVTPLEDAGEPSLEREDITASWKGRRVQHRIFGIGRVEEEEGRGPEARLSVLFPRVGRKKIVARFLQPLDGAGR